jgi:hypothetical protein
MRIVAGRACNPWVVRVETLTVSQPVGLEAYIHDTLDSGCRNLFPRAMALAAEIRRIFCVHVPQVLHWGQLCVTSFETCYVCFARAMASLTLDARD